MSGGMKLLVLGAAALVVLPALVGQAGDSKTTPKPRRPAGPQRVRT